MHTYSLGVAAFRPVVSSLWSSRKHLALGSHWSTGEAMTYITQDNRNMVARLCCLAEGTFEDVKGRDMNDITCLNWHAWHDLGYPTQTMNNLRGSAMYHRVTQPRMRHGARGVDGLPCRLIQLAIASDTSIVSRMAGTQVWPQREHTASGLCGIQVLLVWPFPQNVVMLQSTSVTRYCCCPETCNLNDTRPKAPPWDCWTKKMPCLYRLQQCARFSREHGEGLPVETVRALIEPWPFSIVIAPTSLMTPKDYTTAKAHNTTRTPDFENQHWRVHNKACIGWLLVPQKAVQSKHCKWLFFDFRSKSTLPTAHFHSVQNGWNSSVTAAGTHSFWPLWHPSPVGVAISAKCGDASKY